MNAQAQEKTAQMHWEKLITSKRFGMEQYHDDRHHTRTDFQRDYDRLVFSAPFRRLQNKTQVFPLPGSIFVHNRLTPQPRSIMRRTLIGKQRVGRAQRKIQKRTVVLQTQPLGSHHLGGMSCPRFGKSSFRAFG